MEVTTTTQDLYDSPSFPQGFDFPKAPDRSQTDQEIPLVPDRRGPEPLVDAVFPSRERIQQEISLMLGRELSADLRHWADAYSRVGRRNPYLWGWCRSGVELTTLPCVLPEMREQLCDTKVLGVMLDVLLDDVADQHGDAGLLEHLLDLPHGNSQVDLCQFPPDQQAYAQFTGRVWSEIQRRAKQYPYYHEYADLLRYDYLQLLNTMRYSHLLNHNLALLNLTEHDLYSPHNMHMMVSSTLDLMCSPGFCRAELGLLREVVWHAQCMGRIGNLVTTWQREVKEGDFSSGVFASALSRGDLTVEDLLAGDRQRIEAAIQGGKHETYFLARWRNHREFLLAARKRLRSLDVGELVAGLDRLICLHFGSRGFK
jgi:hypothetical protein